MSQTTKTTTVSPQRARQPFLCIFTEQDDPDVPLRLSSDKSIIRHIAIIYDGIEQSLAENKGLVTTCYFRFKTELQASSFLKTLYEAISRLTPFFTINRLVYRNHSSKHINLVIMASLNKQEVDEHTTYLENSLTTPT